MKNNYTVDIILPVYNSEYYILDTLNSIKDQTYKNWRLIIVDDNSNDETRELIINFINSSKNKKKIILLKNKKNMGQAFSRNYALKYCKSPYMAFIDSDDIWEKNKLKRQIKFMQDNKYVFTYSDYKTYKKGILKIINTPVFFNYKKFIKNTSIATSTMIIKKEILNNIFFPKLKLCEDYYFKCQILKSNYAFNCPGVYSIYRLRDNSLQSNRLKVLLAVWSINKNFNRMNFVKNLISILFIIYNSLKKYANR